MTTHPTEHTHTHHPTESTDLPTWAIIVIYLVLLLILAVVGDLLVFIVGFLGVTIAFASYYSGRGDDHDHH